MMLKAITGIMLTGLLIGMLTLAFNTQQAESSEPPATEWTRTYGGANYDWAWSVVETVDGGYALAGVTYSFGVGGPDFWLVKVDSSGNVQWNKTFGGTDDDGAYSIVETADGGYALAGYTNSFGAGSYDFWLVKIDSSGNLQWTGTYGGAYIDWAWCVVETVDGGYALAGVTASFGAGGYDFWLVKVGVGVGGEVHDVVVISVAPSRTVVGQGFTLSINVTVANQGGHSETFNVTVYANTTIIQTKNVALTSGDFTTVIFTWNTTSFAIGNHTISAVADTVTNETDTADNTYIDGIVTVRLAPVHDVAVVNVTPYKTVVGTGFNMNISVTVENQGDTTETFNVTAYSNTTIIATFENITLISEASTIITFTWNTTGWAKGVYTISANATIVPGETDTADNTYTDGTVRVNMPGDIAPEFGLVDIVDVVTAAIVFGSERGDLNYNPNADVNCDGLVDIVDIVIIVIHFGETDS